MGILWLVNWLGGFWQVVWGSDNMVDKVSGEVVGIVVGGHFGKSVGEVTGELRSLVRW